MKLVTAVTLALAFTASPSLLAETVVDFQRWLEEEVVWIINPQEQEAARELRTFGERAAFVADFWKRRDRSPRTWANPERTVHYDRLKHASRVFQFGGVPGWKTDRGRVWILHGPPDEIRAYPNGSLSFGRYLRDHPNAHQMAHP